MLLYHGSSVIVQQPSFKHSRGDIDFGVGFYLTNDERMAKKWAASKKMAIVNKYEIEIDRLKTHHFSLDAEWLRYVRDNRFKHENSEYNKYDILIGPTADDKLYDSLREYLDGAMTEKETIRVMNVLGYSEQVVMKSEFALENLHFVGAKELQKGEKDFYKEQIIKDRIIAAEKTIELRKMFTKERELREKEDEHERDR